MSSFIVPNNPPGKYIVLLGGRSLEDVVEVGVSRANDGYGMVGFEIDLRLPWTDRNARMVSGFHRERRKEGGKRWLYLHWPQIFIPEVVNTHLEVDFNGGGRLIYAAAAMPLVPVDGVWGPLW